MNVLQLNELLNNNTSVNVILDQVDASVDELTSILSNYQGSQLLSVKKMIQYFRTMDILDGLDPSVESLRKLEANYIDDRFNFTEFHASPNIAERFRSTNLSRVFRVKYNQLERTQSEGYIIPDDELRILEPNHEWNSFMEVYAEEIASRSYENLLNACSNVYRSSTTPYSKLVTFITKSSKTAQISSAQIRDIISEVDSINSLDYQLSTQEIEKYGDGIDKIVIISNSKITRGSLAEIHNHRYIHNIDRNNAVFQMQPTDVFYFSELLVNKNHSLTVPVIEVLKDDEIETLLSTTGWDRDDLTVVSHDDPLIKYLSIPEGNIVRIYRIGNVRSALSRYSIAYRSVKAVPLFVSSKSSKDIRFVEQSYS